MKKLLAVLLSLCLVVGMLPMMAFADDEIPTPTPPTETETTETTPTTKSEDPGQGGDSGNTDGSGGKDDPGSTDDSGAKPPEEPTTTEPEENEPSYEVKVEHGAYNVNSIRSQKELQNALDKNEKNIILGDDIELVGTLTLGDGVTIKSTNPFFGFSGSGNIAITGNVKFDGIKLATDMEVTEAGKITFTDCSADTGVTINAKSNDAVVGAPSGATVVTPATPIVPSDPAPVYYTVTFDVYPYWATVTVKDATDADVTVINNKVTVEGGKTYNYLVSAPGFYDKSGSFTANKNDTITEKLKLETDLLVWPYSHGSVMTEQLGRGWVAVYTEPDSGYYLDDLTIYRVGYGAIDYGKWDNGVYYFRMRAGQQYIIDADFAAAPSEYRVYVDSSILHGDVSVDTVYAEEGEWVYITVDPDVGYRLYNLTVTRPSGNTVKVEHVRDNVYRFSMPGVRVTVDAEFIRTVTPFTDVRLADWFYEYVSFAYRYGLMEGINSYQFAPDATATRAMVVQILYRMSGEPAVSYGSGFTDVASNAWYADAIAWAARNNIVNGTSAATFDPNAPVTREQFATMLYRYARYRGFNTSLTANILSYYDVNQVSEYAFEALQWACAEGIVNGTSTGYLTPQGNATRAQLAAMLMRFCTEYFDL